MLLSQVESLSTNFKNDEFFFFLSFVYLYMQIAIYHLDGAIADDNDDDDDPFNHSSVPIFR